MRRVRWKENKVSALWEENRGIWSIAERDKRMTGLCWMCLPLLLPDNPKLSKFQTWQITLSFKGHSSAPIPQPPSPSPKTQSLVDRPSSLSPQCRKTSTMTTLRSSKPSNKPEKTSSSSSKQTKEIVRIGLELCNNRRYDSKSRDTSKSKRCWGVRSNSNRRWGMSRKEWRPRRNKCRNNWFKERSRGDRKREELKNSRNRNKKSS